jgi:large subunit ribosomal protein L15e
MSYYQYAADQYRGEASERMEELWKERLVEWRDQESIVKTDGPTRVPKARELGYKAKRGFSVVRSRVPKGNTKRTRMRAGRRPKRSGQTRFHPKKSKQVIAEQRASERYENLEVLHSYWVAEDGNYKWYEVILVDPDEPSIESDDDVNWICDQRDRAERGLTPAAKESRGLRSRGKGAEKVRPSQNANDHKGK